MIRTIAAGVMGDNPNFHHKPSGLKVRWYKYIGRGMEITGDVDIEDVSDILIDCLKARK